jgi:ribulose-5-phosphate 4-epimerase/fuculose-1-phosphate aldolase
MTSKDGGNVDDCREQSRQSRPSNLKTVNFITLCILSVFYFLNYTVAALIPTQPHRSRHSQMKEQEGVIKYQLNHTQQSISHLLSLTDINAWRTIAVRLGLIGQTPERYDNIGFGNISQRIDPCSDQFIISGTQTGHIEHLSPEQYCLIVKAEPHKNRLQSCGLCKPSSESMTHASVYNQDNTIQAIIHAHSPEIWKHTVALKLPHTGAAIPYGTVEMASAVEQLFQSGKLTQTSLFTMLGHEDGVVAFGSSMQKAAWELIKYLSLAIGIDQQGITR